MYGRIAKIGVKDDHYRARFLYIDAEGQFESHGRTYGKYESGTFIRSDGRMLDFYAVIVEPSPSIKVTW